MSKVIKRSVSFDELDHENIKKVAERFEFSFSEAVRFIVREFVKHYRFIDIDFSGIDPEKLVEISSQD